MSGGDARFRNSLPGPGSYQQGTGRQDYGQPRFPGSYSGQTSYGSTQRMVGNPLSKRNYPTQPGAQENSLRSLHQENRLLRAQIGVPSVQLNRSVGLQQPGGAYMDGDNGFHAPGGVANIRGGYGNLKDGLVQQQPFNSHQQPFNSQQFYPQLQPFNPQQYNPPQQQYNPQQQQFTPQQHQLPQQQYPQLGTVVNNQVAAAFFHANLNIKKVFVNGVETRRSIK